MEQEKQIQVTSLNIKKISPRPGQTFKEFSVYQISGNDGIVYETTDYDYYSKRSIGEELTIKYRVESRNSNGRVFTSNKIVSPARLSQNNDAIVRAITDRLELMEKNIIARIELSLGSLSVLNVGSVKVTEDDLEGYSARNIRDL